MEAQELLECGSQHEPPTTTTSLGNFVLDSWPWLQTFYSRNTEGSPAGCICFDRQGNPVYRFKTIRLRDSGWLEWLDCKMNLLWTTSNSVCLSSLDALIFQQGTCTGLPEVLWSLGNINKTTQDPGGAFPVSKGFLFYFNGFEFFFNLEGYSFQGNLGM